MSNSKNGSTGNVLDRCAMLNCMGWVGAGAVYTINGGADASISLNAALPATAAESKLGPFTFLKISDSHIGFKKAVNPICSSHFAKPPATSAACRSSPPFCCTPAISPNLRIPSNLTWSNRRCRNLAFPSTTCPTSMIWRTARMFSPVLTGSARGPRARGGKALKPTVRVSSGWPTPSTHVTAGSGGGIHRVVPRLGANKQTVNLHCCMSIYRFALRDGTLAAICAVAAIK
jgi:hypothetical protein